MSGFSAIIPVAQMASANAELEEQGFGPDNFSVPAYTTGQPTHGLFHAWNDPVFQAAVEAIPGVILNALPGDPTTLVTEVTGTVGATWAQNALPLEGVVTPGLHFYPVDGSLWNVIQQYDTNTWPDPNAPGLLALVVPARVPGAVTTWVQPINAFTAYLLINMFTGLPDEVEHNGQVWVVAQGDGSGNNIWEPGVFGWVLKP